MITMNNSYNQNVHASSSRMHLGLPPNPIKFGTGLFSSCSLSQPPRLTFDTTSPLTPPNSSTSSVDNPINKPSPLSCALSHHQLQSNILDSCDRMFGSYKDVGESDLFNSPRTDICGRVLTPKNSEPEVESSVDESRSSCVLTANCMATYNSRSPAIDNSTHNQKFDEAFLPPRSPGSHAKAALALELSNQEFTQDETKKIMRNKKLAELALADPKRVKRILANRQSAARSKEKKMRYVMELEHKVHILETKNAALSAQLTLLQGESMGLAGRNNELRILFEALVQQSQIKNVLNEALKEEVERLKLEAREPIT